MKFPIQPHSTCYIQGYLSCLISKYYKWSFFIGQPSYPVFKLVKPFKLINPHLQTFIIVQECFSKNVNRLLTTLIGY